VDCSRDVETRPPNKRLTQCRVIACAANMYSAEQCVFIFVNTDERVNLNNVKGHFGISMAKEVYRENPVFKIGKKLERTGNVLTLHAGGRCRM
jgi:hypothetical protein